MRLVTPQVLSELQRCPSNVRNICIMAHVDHGKTTLADSLVASNGVISQRMAGKLRYMDSRKDEQERGITMKSSSIALYYNTGQANYLINLIDSPGHVDFSSEVSTAVRLCDGAIIVVDVVEGVCSQTQVCLRQAWLENIRPVLVLNKIDRLILEMKLSPLDAYVHLAQILEKVNAVTGELFASEVFSKAGEEDEQKRNTKREESDDVGTYEWSAGLEEADDSQLYFAPEQGNVVFASAFDGWGFRIQDFAKLYAAKLGVKETVLLKTLWGDFFLNSKSKRVMKGAQEKAKKPLFVQFVLENLWSVYDAIAIRKDKTMLEKIVNSLNLKLTARDLRHTDAKVQIQAVCSQWLPLAKAVLSMVCEKLPSPLEIQPDRVEKLMCSITKRFDSFPPETQALKSSFLACSSSSDSPLIVFVSKMFPVDRKTLPQNKQRPLSAEEMNNRRVEARKRHAERLAVSAEGVDHEGNISSDKALVLSEGVEQFTEEQIESLKAEREAEEKEKEEELGKESDVFIAFARVFSGSIRKGQRLFVLGPKHNPETVLQKLHQGEEIDSTLTLKDLPSGQHVTSVVIEHLYLLMGRELEELEEVPAGNVLGIGGLEDHVLKSATLSSTVACPSFTELTLMAEPIVRVAVEPARPADLPALVRGLRFLNQADACVKVLVQETGEHVLITAGEVHLQRCLDDLRERYAKVEINASQPIVPFRETIVPPPKLDMVNESILEKTQSVKKNKDIEQTDNPQGVIEISTSNKQSLIRIRAVPLPEEVTELLEKSAVVLKEMEKELSVYAQSESVSDGKALRKIENVLTTKTLRDISDLKCELERMFNESGPEWKGAVDQIWSFGPRRCGPNILLNRIASYQERPSAWERMKKVAGSRLTDFDSSFVSGFQLATLAGPLCEEPMMGVCFVVDEWVVHDKSSDDDAKPSESMQPFGPLSGQIMSAVKDGCRRAFQAQPQRLMAAMYSCSIMVSGEVLGKMYAVLGRRHGRVLYGDQQEGSATFTVKAVLPVVESFNFADEIRRQTSGMASPQMVFSHWEVIDVDPFWVPTTEEELLHFGEKADSENRARKYRNAVRRRKGLPVEEKLVEFAEKQRTLNRKK